MQTFLSAVLLGVTVAGAQQCLPMTNVEILTNLRTSLNCSSRSPAVPAVPTSCACIANGATEYACPAMSVTAWNSAGQQCVSAKSDLNANWDRHANGWHYQADYGESCKVHAEPGSYACTKVEAADFCVSGNYKTHAFQNNHAGYNNLMNSAGWCTANWCYVDPCICDATDFMASSWFRPRELYYSYEMCGAVNTFSSALCTSGTTESTCTTLSNCKWDPTGTTTTTTTTDAGGGATATGCLPMTPAEILADLRTRLNCASRSPAVPAVPTSCACIVNGATEYACPAISVTAWNSAGQQCVSAKSDLNANWDRHANGWDYQADYGESCKVHAEPGSYACTKVQAADFCASGNYKTHAFENNHAGYNNLMNSAGWCTANWCYVDPCICDATDFMASSWFRPRELYYSYEQCGAVNTFSAALCTSGTTAATCTTLSNCKWVPPVTTTPTTTTTNAGGGAGTNGDVAQCLPMTNVEVLADLRTSLNCSSRDPAVPAVPTSCACIENGATEYSCPAMSVTAWNSAGQQCVSAKSDLNANWDRHANGWDYQADYGESCKVHAEPGSYACTKVQASDFSTSGNYKTHAFQNNHAGYNNVMDSEGWCTANWCYVDPCICNATDFMASSWFRPRALYYSYELCGAVNTFSAALCTSGTTESTCAALSNCKWVLPTTTTTDDGGVSANHAVPQRMVAPLLTLLMLGAFVSGH